MREISPVVRQPEGVCGAGGYGYHGYWAEGWYDIDAHFGTPAELIALSSALKARGMCLVLDIVLNHVRPVRPTSGASDVALAGSGPHRNGWSAGAARRLPWHW